MKGQIFYGNRVFLLFGLSWIKFLVLSKFNWIEWKTLLLLSQLWKEDQRSWVRTRGHLICEISLLRSSQESFHQNPELLCQLVSNIKAHPFSEKQKWNRAFMWNRDITLFHSGRIKGKHSRRKWLLRLKQSASTRKMNFSIFLFKDFERDNFG